MLAQVHTQAESAYRCCRIHWWLKASKCANPESPELSEVLVASIRHSTSCDVPALNGENLLLTTGWRPHLREFRGHLPKEIF